MRCRVIKGDASKHVCVHPGIYTHPEVCSLWSCDIAGKGRTSSQLDGALFLANSSLCERWCLYRGTVQDLSLVFMATVELHVGCPSEWVLLANCVLQGGCEADRAAFPSLVLLQPTLPNLKRSLGVLEVS